MSFCVRSVRQMLRKFYSRESQARKGKKKNKRRSLLPTSFAKQSCQKSTIQCSRNSSLDRRLFTSVLQITFLIFFPNRPPPFLLRRKGWYAFSKCDGDWGYDPETENRREKENILDVKWEGLVLGAAPLEAAGKQTQCVENFEKQFLIVLAHHLSGRLSLNHFRSTMSNCPLSLYLFQ